MFTDSGVISDVTDAELSELSREDNPQHWYTVGFKARSIGLGDVFAAFTWVTGISYVWKRWHAWRGTGCGCAARRHRWNLIRIRLPIARVKL